MVKHGIKDVDDFDIAKKGLAPGLFKSMIDINNNVKDGLKKKKFSANKLTEVGLSILESYKANPALLRENTEFLTITNYLVEMIDVYKGQGMKMNKNALRIYKILKDSFYNPDKYKMNMQTRKFLAKTLCNKQKKKYRYR